MNKNRFVKYFTLPIFAVLALFGWRVAMADSGEIIEFDEAQLFFEQNATDGDLGLHLKVDGEGWYYLLLTDSDDTPLLEVELDGNLGNVIGLTELFSESAEPSFDDLPKEDFLDLFPEDVYYYYACTLEGDWMFGEVELTHNLPGEVELLSPEEDAEVKVNQDLKLEWEEVPDPDAPDSVIEFYEVVVEKDEDEELHRVLSVTMLPGQTKLRVPKEFLEAGKEYKIEIIAQESSGNRTAIEVPFETRD